MSEIKITQNNVVQIPMEGDLHKAIFLGGKITLINGRKVDIPIGPDGKILPK